MGTHNKQWSSDTPGLLIFLIDQSGSMLEPYSDIGETRTVFASKLINKVIREMIVKNFCGTTPKNRCFVVAIGYSLGAKELCSGYLADLHSHPKRFEKIKQKKSDGDGGLVEIEKDVPVWVEPIDEDGWTDMAQGFRMAKEIIERWIVDNPDSPAPVVINVSDGMPYYDHKDFSECARETADIAKEIMEIKTSDGNALIFNAEIGQGITEIELPNSIEEVKKGGKGAEFLYEISSIVPEGYKNAAEKNGLQLKEDSRGAVFAAEADSLIKLIDFGSSKGRGDQ